MQKQIIIIFSNEVDEDELYIKAIELIEI